MLRRRFNIYVFAGLPFVVWLIVSCQSTPRQLNLKAYEVWSQDTKSGLVVVNADSQFVFEARYLPPQLRAVELTQEPLQDSTLKRLTNEQSKWTAFLLTIRDVGSGQDPLKVGLTNKEDYQSRRDDLTHASRDRFKLLIDADTQACVFHHLEDYHGQAPYIRFHLMFEVSVDQLKGSGQPFQLFYNDQTFGRNLVTFSFDQFPDYFPELQL